MARHKASLGVITLVLGMVASCAHPVTPTVISNHRDPDYQTLPPGEPWEHFVDRFESLGYTCECGFIRIPAESVFATQYKVTCTCKS